MPAAVTERNRAARELFAPLASTYDRYARVLSFGQDPRWRAFLVSRIGARPADTILDVATGTAAVAVELTSRYGCSVVGVDQSEEMLGEGRRRIAASGLETRIELVQARAEELPFEAATFDGLTFTYLLRYVEDPAATLCELARVVRPGGRMAMLEFSIPRHAPARLAWEWVRAGRAAPPRQADLTRMAGSGRVPETEHPRVLRALAARASAGGLA